MEKTLVLVRHGKPEHGAIGMPDADRALTPEGAAALAAPDGFPRIFAHLTEAELDTAELWVSPALRARQTADAIEDALRHVDTADSKALPRSEHESLWEQDLSGFLQEVAQRDAGCIVAVGHIPFMNEALEFLTGETSGFTPGTVAAVRLPHGFEAARASRSGQLLWYERGPKV